MPGDVVGVVRQRAQRKGELVHGLGVAKQGGDEVAAAGIVQQVAEELVAEGVVAEVLNDRAAVGERPRVFERFGRRAREPLEQERLQLAIPGHVDGRLVSQHRVGIN